MPQDSRGNRITVGSRVTFRWQHYTIKGFLDTTVACGTSQIEFEEEQHTKEIADEISVDLIR